MNEQVNFPTMSDRERYLFDLQGFIVIKGMLSTAEVKALNEALDTNHDKRKDDTNSSAPGPLAGEHKRGLYQNMLSWEKPWCLPFRDLLAHRKIIPYLNTLLGRGWKLDHNLFIYTAKKGTEGLGLHGHGAVNFSGSRFYAYQNGRMRCGLINCQYQLADVNPGDGGLCVVPGSHKTNFPIPRDIARWEADQQIVYQVPMKAGDLVIFSESTTHGTLPWTSDNERRSLFYRYTPMYLHYTGGVYETTMPEWVSELTEVQKAVLQPPYVYNRPLIEEDGETVVTPRREGE
jgi:ectoine hydroxylase-related dioxygenase (phytanoyl-CoA dioxygenase family)